MSDLNNYSNILIIGIPKQMEEIEKYLLSSWLPTIDIESVLSIIFTCFISIPNFEHSVKRTITWMIHEGLDFKDISPIQKSFIVEALQRIMQDIYDELLQQGFLNFDYFPYEFKQTLPDKSIVLTKITNTGCAL